MDHYMPPIAEHISLSTNEAEDDIDVSSVSDISGDDHPNRRLVTDTSVARPQSHQESQFNDVPDAGHTLTALPPMPLHHSARIVSQSTSGSYRNLNPQPEEGAKPITRKPQKSLGPVCTSYWTWEILALLVSFLALTMIVLILYLYQGRSLLDWPYAISINSLISIFSAVMKAALFVPVAACVSQAKWDWFHRQQGHTLADMEIYDQASRGPGGALRMLTEIRWRHFSSLGALIIVLALAIDPMAQQIISYYPVQVSTNITSQDVTIPQSWGFTSNSSEIQPSMINAVKSGLSGSSSNCWPPSTPSGQPYESLAVCASCTKDPRPQCPEVRMSALLPPVTLKDRRVQIVNASYIVRTPDNQELQAGECALYWCLKNYSIGVDGNSTSIETQSQSSNSSNKGLKVYNIVSAHADRKTFWVDVLSSERISKWMSEQLTGGYPDEKGLEHTQPQLRDKVDRTRGSHDDSEQCPRKPDSNKVPNTASYIIMALGNSSSRSIEKFFYDIAAALTDEIQSSPRPDEPTTFIGKAQAVRTSQTTIGTNLIIHVQWAWLALPIDLVVLALIFQIITMVRTSRRKTAIWKSSTLALFFHGRGVRGGVRSTGGAGMDDIAVMEDLAGRMKVRLENDGRDWCLTEERRRVV
ncbi:hypothetical protein MMC22_002051 [Lobaria immixta]|nr:hypothetical protein [Lobaria immixta]